MKYKEALQIGSKAFGVIKCTYAKFYPTPKTSAYEFPTPLFAMQHEAIRAFPTIGDCEVHTPEGFLREGWKTDYWGVLQGLMIADQMPIVEASDYSEDRLVPAHLLPEAVDLMKKSILGEETRYSEFLVRDYNLDEVDAGHPGETAFYLFEDALPNYLRAEQYTYTLLRINDGNPDYPAETVISVYKNPTSEEVKKLVASVNAKNNTCKGKGFHYDLRVEETPNFKFNAIMDIDPNNNTVWIKPAAFDWHPANVDNVGITTDDPSSPLVVEANGQTMTLGAAKEYYERRIRQDKLLIGGGAVVTLL